MKTKHFDIPYSSYLVAVVIALTVGVGQVRAQETTTSAKKNPKPVPPGLWVIDGTGSAALPSISAFTAAQLTKKTGTVGSFGLRLLSAVGPAEALTFDSQHNLWISFCAPQPAPGQLIELGAAGLKKPLSGASVKTIVGDPAAPGDPPQFLACPRSLAFDPSGNLWVETTGGTSPALLEYAAADLIPLATENEVTPTPTVIHTGPLQTNFAPVLAFDKTGNLWQSGGVIAGQDQTEQQTVVEYTAAQLEAGALQTIPNQTLIVADTSVPDTLNAPSAITFDAAGNLWVAFALDGTSNTGGVEMIAAGELAGQGTATPVPTITLGQSTFKWGKVALQSFANPDGLAFDNLGNLWVANQAQESAKLGQGSLVEFTASELTVSGNPMPVRAILANKKDTNLGAPGEITFGPGLQ